MGTLGRKPITIIEIDFPICNRVFGVGLCGATLTAGQPHQCFNSLKTCSFPSAYNPVSTLTLRFAENQTGLPAGVTVFPLLASVTDEPSEINLAGVDPKSTALGRRGRLTVELLNHTYHDSLTDPYYAERRTGAAQWNGIAYKPENRGTMLGKLLARFPYYGGLALRKLEGEVGQALGSMEVEHYVISEWSGATAGGRHRIVAKDLIDLADNDRALAPAVSRGKLSAAITAS